MGELGTEACSDNGQSTTNTPPPPRTPPPPGNGADAPCASYPEFVAQSAAVTAACCDDPAAPCSGTGTPSVCSTACAAVLLPMQRACADLLVMLGMQAAIDGAAANCPAPAPAIPCADVAEFGAASQTVTAACCDDPAHPCVAGLPTFCSHSCGAVLPQVIAKTPQQMRCIAPRKSPFCGLFSSSKSSCSFH